MLMFSDEELTRVKQRLRENPRALDDMKKYCDERIKGGVKVPETARATWSHYYACPKDAARLEYRYDEPNFYRCPVCGATYSGEPYEGAWWRITNDVNCSAAHNSALLWVLTGEEKYRDLGKQILTLYAKYYPDYEEHGDIPYNRQGKMNSQSICESACLSSLAIACDLLKDALLDEERRYIEDRLLLPGGALLLKNRTPQLHNHEVIVSAGLGVIGLVTEREDYIQAAVYAPYGLKYQLEHGLLEDGMWFEGSFGYHFFALSSFVSYERMAKNTPYSLLSLPHYRRMYEMPLKLLKPNGAMPMISDFSGNGLIKNYAWQYEFMYERYRCDFMAGALNLMYKGDKRDISTHLLSGADEIAPVSLPEPQDYHDAEGSGLTLMRGSDKRQYLLFRHGRYGGEHDHYDKLSISFAYDESEILPDFGTVAYGSPPHYGYFKNTFTHNTVSINCKNQPPCNGSVARYEKRGGVTLIEARADWTMPAPALDSFTIKQWDDEAYRGVKMARAILHADDYFIEAFRVQGAAGRTVDWVIHPRGECHEFEAPKHEVKLNAGAIENWLKNPRGFDCEGGVLSAWTGEKGRFTVFSDCSCPSEVIYVDGAGNPMSETVTYFIRRVADAPNDLVFATIFNLGGGHALENRNISIDGGKITASFTLDGKEYVHSLTVGEDD